MEEKSAPAPAPAATHPANAKCDCSTVLGAILLTIELLACQTATLKAYLSLQPTVAPEWTMGHLGIIQLVTKRIGAVMDDIAFIDETISTKFPIPGRGVTARVLVNPTVEQVASMLRTMR